MREVGPGYVSRLLNGSCSQGRLTALMLPGPSGFCPRNHGATSVGGLGSLCVGSVNVCVMPL